MKIKNIVKKIIFNDAYLNLYPLTEKGQPICDRINNCDLLDDTDQLAKDIKDLYRFVLSKRAVDTIDSDTLNRNLDNCFKTKRVKIKDEEEDKKVVEKIQVERKGVGVKRDIKRFNAEKQNVDDDASQLELLADNIKNGKLQVTDLPLCDKVLRYNRISTRVYIAIVIVIILIIVFSFL